MHTHTQHRRPQCACLVHHGDIGPCGPWDSVNIHPSHTGSVKAAWHTWEKKLGAHAMKRVAAGAHLRTPWLFEPAKHPDDRADYCLDCSFLLQAPGTHFLHLTHTQIHTVFFRTITRMRLRANAYFLARHPFSCTLQKCCHPQMIVLQIAVHWLGVTLKTSRDLCDPLRTSRPILHLRTTHI